MKKLFLVIFMFVLCSLGKAQDDRWTFISSTEGADNVTKFWYVDNTSLKYSSNYGVKTCYAWIKTVFLGDEKRDYIIAYWLYNCDDKSSTTLRATVYFHDKSFFDYENFSDKKYIIPDSIGETILNYVCSK